MAEGAIRLVSSSAIRSRAVASRMSSARFAATCTAPRTAAISEPRTLAIGHLRSATLALRGNAGQRHALREERMAKFGGERFDALVAEMDRAVDDVVAFARAEPSCWERSRPRKWSVGGHAAHLVIAMKVTVDAFEERAPRVLDGTIAPVPRRGPLESLWVWTFVHRGFIPRGARTPRRYEPASRPDLAETLDQLRREAGRHRVVGHRLTADQRDRLWIVSPFITRWHYGLGEMVRAHAVHARHHLALMREIG